MQLETDKQDPTPLHQLHPSAKAGPSAKDQQDVLAILHEPRPLYRGVWAEQLFDGQQLPVGGSLFSQNLNTKLELDFGNLAEETQGFTEEALKKSFLAMEPALKEWLVQIGSTVDPYTLFTATRVMQKTQAVLAYDATKPTKHGERNAVYSGSVSPKLSMFKGKAMCVEYAALGQYLLQKVGVASSYVTGVTVVNPHQGDVENHSFLVISAGKEELIFDIARPSSEQNVPRLMRPVVPFTYDLLKDKENLVIKAEDVLRPGHAIYFGVGNPLFSEDPNIIAAA